jgi:hypothetical protein
MWRRSSGWDRAAGMAAGFIRQDAEGSRFDYLIDH